MIPERIDCRRKCHVSLGHRPQPSGFKLTQIKTNNNKNAHTQMDVVEKKRKGTKIEFKPKTQLKT